MRRNTTSETLKKDLLARKEKLIQEIKYYEKRIKDCHNNSSKLNFDGNVSSDSDEDCSFSLDVGPSIGELKTQNSLMTTCLKATQELTSLNILQTHHSIMVENPVIDGVMVVSEPGMWREVAAECYIDLVSFSMTFYTHQPSRKFAAASFRGLKVLPVKKLQEAELSHHSLLASATCPSDAIDVIRCYADAYRSRRTTMHRLAKMFPRNLFMEPLADGGFITNVANVLQISWHLENHISTIAPFHHKMKFQIEHVEESYLKIIKQLYKQLASPSLETDERTLLLSKLINTCSEAHPNLDSESDLEADRQTNAHDHPQDIDEQTDRRDNADDQVMAPPKAIPRKAKPKGKENSGDNHKSTKRSAGHDCEIDNGKKAKIDGNSGKTFDDNENTVSKNSKIISSHKNNVIDVGKTAKTLTAEKADTNDGGKDTLADDNIKKLVDRKTNIMGIRNNAKSVSEIVKSNEENQKNKVIRDKKAQKHDENVDHVDKTERLQNSDKASRKQINRKNKEIDFKNVEDSQKRTRNENNAVEKNNTNSEKITGKASFKKTEIKDIKGAQDKVEHMKDADFGKKQVNNDKTDKNKPVIAKQTKSVKKPSDIDKNANDLKSNVKNVEVDKGNEKSTEVTENIAKTATSSKPKNIQNIKVKENDKSNHPKNFEAAKTKTANVKTILENVTGKKDNIEAKGKKSNNSKEKAVEKSDGVLMNNKKITGPNIPTDSHTKNKENITNAKSPENKNKVAPPKNVNKQVKHNISLKHHRNTVGKVTKTLSVPKNVSKDSGMSKIPQKKLSPAYAAALQQIPVRMSPRMTAKFKSASDSNLQAKIVKPVSKLPRLLKPAPMSK